VIELVIASRCTGCNACVEACPTNVFEASEGQPPVIARQEDCQTCYMCELYCPADALFVGSDCERAEGVVEQQLIASGLLGQFRRDHGWGPWATDPRFKNQHWYMGEVFRRARADAAAASPTPPAQPSDD
jgi:NAD-dependent dihydropyrimidine dehydrogenase PreA subunit